MVESEKIVIQLSAQSHSKIKLKCRENSKILNDENHKMIYFVLKDFIQNSVYNFLLAGIYLIFKALVFWEIMSVLAVSPHVSVVILI